MLSLRNFTIAASLSSSSHSAESPHTRCSCRGGLLGGAAAYCRVATAPCCSLRIEELSIKEPLDAGPDTRDPFRLLQNGRNDLVPGGQQEEEEEEEDEEEEEKGISKIRVPREKYIPVSKAEILDAIVRKLFDSQYDSDQFRLLSSCLDSILHAEHKSILEEMRADYSLINSKEGEAESDEGLAAILEGKSSNEINGIDSAETFGEKEKDEEEGKIKFDFNYGLDLRNLLASSAKIDKKYSNGESRLGVATRFQRAFMQLLDHARFQELSARDLILTSALNSDYLLTLPIYVDWKKASESNAIVFRRGYETEREKGLLIVEKLDYLQSRLLQQIFFLISKPLRKLGKWMKEAIRNASEAQEVRDWVNKITRWLTELSLLRQSYLRTEQGSDNPLRVDQLSDSDLPIWLAAQRAVSRYEGFLSPVGPRERLFRKLLAWIGLAQPMPETPFELDADNSASEPYLRPILLSRISLGDIWRPAKYIKSGLWKMIKTSFSILFSQSILQEPAYQELILLYTDQEARESYGRDKAEQSSFQLKIYEKIPIPDLPVVFPHKKLFFRIIDTVRLDVASILGLSAYFINYKFEDIVSSPSAILLDVIAISALIIYVTRVALGYKQTWDRYQLLVNKTLYEKTLASGFGSVHFLLDASEQQQYKEAILTYAILLKAKNGQVTCLRWVGDECERFLYDAFKVKVEMPIDKAMSTLVRLGLAIQTPVDGRIKQQAVPSEKAYKALRERWNRLLG